MMRRCFLLMAVVFFVVAYPVAAQETGAPSDTVLENPVLEARARSLMKELRCLVCQNQSIDDSDALLARELRSVVRERVKSGDSDRQVKDYLVARYGDWVLLSPPFDGRTIFLWVSPFLFLVIGFVFFLSRRKPVTQIVPLSRAEALELEKIMDAGDRE